METFDQKRFSDLLDTRIFGRRLMHLRVTGSTNDYAADLIRNSSKDEFVKINGTLILSDEQTGGRGRFNRRWVSPPGGLWFSLIFYTGLPMEKIPALTLIFAFSAADMLIRDYGVDMNVKWPNDLYCNGMKLGGILSEEIETAENRFIIMGMGLNIDVEKNHIENLGKKAINLREVTRGNIDTEELLAHIMGRFEELYLYYENTGDLDSIFRKISEILRY